MASNRRGVVAGYEQLAELADAELALVRAGEWERLAEIDERRREVMASLPDQAPEDAWPMLDRTAELQRRVSAELAKAIAITREQLGRLDRGRSAVRGYAPALERRKLVDSAG
jgi:hypothetical protein